MSDEVENDINEALEGAEQGEGKDAPTTFQEPPGEGTPIEDEAPEFAQAELPERDMPTIDEDRSEMVGTFEEPDYAEILGIDDHDEIEEEAEVTAEAEEPPAEPEVEQELEPPPPVEPEPEVVAEAEPEEETEVEAESSQEEIPAAEATPETPTAEEYTAALKEHMDKSLPVLEKQYSLSEEEAAIVDDLDSKPSEWLPKMLAKLHYNAFITSYQAAQANLPEKVGQITKQQIANENAAKEFFDEYPELKKHQDVAAQSIMAFRQLNPNATPEEIRKGSGALAMITIGRVPRAVVAEAGPISEVPAAPVEIPPQPIQPGASAERKRLAGDLTYEQTIFADMVDEDRRIGN